MNNANNMDKWFNQVLSNKSVVDQLLGVSEEAVNDILNKYTEQQVEEIKICADFLYHKLKDEKYLGVADVVADYQARVGQRPNFGRK